MITLNTKEFSTVITAFKDFNNSKDLQVEGFKDLHLYFKGESLFLITVGDFKADNKVTMIYRFDIPNDFPEELNEQFYTLNISNVVNILKYFSENISLSFSRESVSFIDSVNSERTVNVYRVETPEEVIDYLQNQINNPSFLDFTKELMNPLSDDLLKGIREQVAFRALDKLENNSYISFLPDKITTQQFNYATCHNIDYGFKGRLPTPVLKIMLKYSESENVISIEREENIVEIRSENMKIIVTNVDDNIHSVDNFRYDPDKKLIVDKGFLLDKLNLIRGFCNQKTGFLSINSGEVVLRNTPLDNSETTNIFISDVISTEHTLEHQETFGFDIEILRGLVSLVQENTVEIHIEKDSDDVESYLLYVLDSNTKNIMAVEVYK